MNNVLFVNNNYFFTSCIKTNKRIRENKYKCGILIRANNSIHLKCPADIFKLH